MKIGMVQNTAQAGALSANLRQVVQGCRACLDAGADWVVASAQALDGAFPEHLSRRSSFLIQSQAALAALSSELSIPLILAGYAAPPNAPVEQPRPFLLHQGAVQPLPNRTVAQVLQHRVFVDASPLPQAAPLGTACDFIVHLPQEPWHLGQQHAWLRMAQQEARELRCPVILMQGIGCSHGALMAGGSLVATPEGSIQLPLFQDAERVWHPAARSSQCATSPAPLSEAAAFCLRLLPDNSASQGFAVDMESPRGALLAALCRQAVGARRVVALASQKTPAAKLAGKFLALPPMPDASSAQLRARYRAALLTTLAEEHELFLLSDASLSSQLLGAEPAAYGAFAPFGDMLDSELSLLREQILRGFSPSMGELLPPPNSMPPLEEKALRLLVLENRSTLEIAATHPDLEEWRLRRLLRQLKPCLSPIPALLLHPTRTRYDVRHSLYGGE